MWSFMIRLSLSCSIDRQHHCRREELDDESDFREFDNKLGADSGQMDKWIFLKFSGYAGYDTVNDLENLGDVAFTPLIPDFFYIS